MSIVVPSIVEYAFCPYCYEGIVEYDNINKIFFCCTCGKLVKIKKWCIETWV